MGWFGWILFFLTALLMDHFPALTACSHILCSVDISYLTVTSFIFVSCSSIYYEEQLLKISAVLLSDVLQYLIVKLCSIPIRDYLSNQEFTNLHFRRTDLVIHMNFKTITTWKVAEFNYCINYSNNFFLDMEYLFACAPFDLHVQLPGAICFPYAGSWHCWLCSRLHQYIIYIYTWRLSINISSIAWNARWYYGCHFYITLFHISVNSYAVASKYVREKCI